jgi:hypothetical protein
VAPPGAHYISKVALAPWLLRLLALGKANNSYSVNKKHLFVHGLNKGGEEGIMKDGLMAKEGAYTGAAVRAHTMSESEIAAVDRSAGGTNYYFVTAARARQEFEGAMTGVEWNIQYMPTIGWILRLPDGSFFVSASLGGEGGDKDGSGEGKEDN